MEEKIEYTDTINYVVTTQPDLVAGYIDELNERIAELEQELVEKDKEKTQLAIHELSEVERLLYESHYKEIDNRYYAEYEDIKNLIDSRIQALEELKGEKDDI